MHVNDDDADDDDDDGDAQVLRIRPRRSINKRI